MGCQFLKEKILRKIEEYDLNDEDSAKPFQHALFTKKGYLAKGFIHGCETALSNSQRNCGLGSVT